MTHLTQLGVAGRPKPGEEVSGDQSVMIRDEHEVFFVLADGLGHGLEAHRAASAACRCAEQNPRAPLLELMAEMNRALSDTRGAAVVLCRIDTESGDMSHVGVGNVEVTVSGASRNRPISTPGIVGSRLRKLVENRVQLQHGDIVAAYTDGLHSGIDLDDYSHLDAQRIADALLTDWAKSYDDATCVVVVY